MPKRNVRLQKDHMRCEKCGMIFQRAETVPEHNVWGSRTKTHSTRCHGSGLPPRKSRK